MPPDALLFISSHCPHCPAVLTSLADLLKRGVIGRLDVVNLEVHPEEAEAHGVRSVPWMRIGLLELSGLRSATELETWAKRQAEDGWLEEAFRDLLKHGDLKQVLRLVARQPEHLSALLPILGDADAAMNLRLGAAAAVEAHAGSPALHALVPALGQLSEHPNATIRADACHCLGLAGNNEARQFLQARLEDENDEVREIAKEGFEG